MTPLFRFLLLLVGSSLWGGCLVVDGPTILARHLAAGAPVLASIDPSTPFGLAPSIGHRRIIAAPELEGWAKRHGATLEPAAEICVERKTVPLSSESVLEALVAALQRDFKLTVAPSQINDLNVEALLPESGKIALLAPGLTWSADKQLLNWRGQVLINHSSTRYPISIRFKLEAQAHRLVASRDLEPMTILNPADIQSEAIPWRPGSIGSELSLDDLVGKALRRRIAKGTQLLAIHVKAPPLILSGDSVELISRAGQAQIRIKAKATHNAYAGEVVVVRREDSPALLRGVAFAPGVVVIDKQTSHGRVQPNSSPKGIVHEDTTIDAARQP